MNYIETMYQLQRKLDERIASIHAQDYVPQKDTRPNQHIVLALLVELGELANETRCFKIWSVKGPSERDVILEEYVDGVHFILSLGISMEYIVLNPKQEDASDVPLTQVFLDTYDKIESFSKQPNLQTYTTMFEQFLLLGSYLAFDMASIYEAYVLKNQTNHKRQENNY